MARNVSIEQFRQKALDSLYFFDRYVLGFNSASHPHKRGMEENPHKELCDFVQDWSSGKKKKLLCVPRKSLKSSCITVGYSLFELAHDPSMTILIDSVERAIAAGFLSQIRSIAEVNQTFWATFGSWVNTRGWTGHELTIKDKPATKIQEPSIGTAGVDSSKVAFHPKLMILDDLVNRDTVRTPQALMKTIRHYLDLTPMLGEDGRIVMVATRWDQDDLISYVLENELDEWDVLIRSSINDDGTAYYPEMLSLKWIKEQLDKDPYFASCQYLNDPLNPSATMFDKTDIEWYQDNSELPEQRTNYITVDPAGHEGSIGDKTAVLAAGVDREQNIYFYEPDYDRFDIDQIVDTIFTKYLFLKIRKVGIEQNYYRGALAKAFQLRGRQWGIKVRIEELKHYGRTERKEDRISALKPWFVDGKIFLKGKKIKIGDKEQWIPVGKNMKQLYQQIIAYPRAKMNDDLIDAAAMFLEIIQPSGGLDPLNVKVAKPVDAAFGY